jgi:hypothetical protein
MLTLFFPAEDNMNVQLKDITVTARDGRVSHLDQVYIRGSHVKFFIVPDMLRYYISTGYVVYVLTFAETHPCSVRAASAVEVSVLLVVRRRCRGLGDNGGVDLVDFFSLAFPFSVWFFVIPNGTYVGLKNVIP